MFYKFNKFDDVKFEIVNPFKIYIKMNNKIIGEGKVCYSNFEYFTDRIKIKYIVLFEKNELNLDLENSIENWGVQIKEKKYYKVLVEKELIELIKYKKEEEEKNFIDNLLNKNIKIILESIGDGDYILSTEIKDNNLLLLHNFLKNKCNNLYYANNWIKNMKLEKGMDVTDLFVEKVKKDNVLQKITF